MAELQLGGKVIATQTGTDNPVINSATTFAGNVSDTATFPAGHVLQVLSGSYNVQTTIGAAWSNIIEITGTAKGTNSKFLALWTVVYGGDADAHGFALRVNMNSGTSSTNNVSDIMSVIEPTYIVGTYYTDWSRAGAYNVETVSGSVTKTSTFSTGNEISFGLWGIGISTMYLNRSTSRVDYEAGITSLDIFEIAQ